MKALILASGKGINLVPFTSTRPKPMINVGGRFILENTIRLLKESGINVINIVVGHEADTIVKYFERGGAFGVNIHYAYQKKVTGIGDAVYMVKDRFNPGEYFILVYGDIITSANIFNYTLQSFNMSKEPVASVCLTTSTKMFGNVYLNDEMRITNIIEKPRKGGLGNYVLSGVFILPSGFFSILEKTKFNMEKALRMIIKEIGLRASIWEGDWIDVVYPWDILLANKIIMDSLEMARISKSALLKGDVRIEGPVQIEDNVEIRAGTIIEGPSFIGANSFIGNNVLIRKYTSIGKGCTIGYGVELKNCILFGNSRVGRLSFIGDSVIGSNVDIGSGIMTINGNLDRSSVKSEVNRKIIDTHLNKLGAFIGDDAVIGSGNTLMAGAIIDTRVRIPHHYTYPKS
ncbi:MAG: NTP transferase domain-containing protein [Nitrospinae bacterium]|nr:NTP transferase domain-containing protein [Nitrospinota bacterium]